MLQEIIERFLSEPTPLPKLIVIYGPTACGKTAMSIEVAKYLNSEIISTDSRQIYRGLDIGTGKIRGDEMLGISHHMIDIIDPSEVFSMVDFSNRALPLIEELLNTGTIPILCGGTGLYIDALLYEMALPDVEPDWKYREELESLRQSEGNIALWNMLQGVDPEYAKELSPENYRYVMRGLEVMRDTGKSKRESQNTKVARFSPLFLTPYEDDIASRKSLYEKINTRVQGMFECGLIEETVYNRNIYTASCPGLATIGYKEVIEYLDSIRTLEETIALVQQHSRNYAKRQITWNKRYPL